MGTLFLLSQGYLAAVLGVAALAKFNNLSAFSDALRKQRTVPSRFIPMLSILVPAVEAVTALFLVIGLFPLVGAGSCLFLCTCFFIAKVLAARRGPTADCGCFGASSAKAGAVEALTVSFVLLAVSLLAFGLAASNSATDNRLPVLSPVGVGLALLAGVVIARRLRLPVQSSSNDHMELAKEAGHP